MAEHSQYAKTVQEIAEVVYADDGPEMELEVTVSDTDELLIDLVKTYPFLYSKQMKDHKDRNMKANAWNEIATVLNMTDTEAEHRWGILRDKFSRERKIREKASASGSASNIAKPWVLYDRLSFLNEHVNRRKTKSSVHPSAANPKKVVKPHQNDTSTTSTSNGVSPSSSSGTNFAIPSTPVLDNRRISEVASDLESDSSFSSTNGGTGKFKKAKNNDQVDQEFKALSVQFRQYYSDKMVEKKEKAANAANDASKIEDQFAALIAAELKRLPETVRNEKKMKITAILYAK